MADTMNSEARDQFAAEMRSIIADTEELLRATMDVTSDGIVAARARAQETLRQAKQKLSDIDDRLVDQTRQAARSADRFVRENPWGAVGLAAAAGLLIGLAISRRGDRT